MKKFKMTKHDHPYKIQQIEGEMAAPGTACPVPKHEIGARSAWLAGHYDKHGRDAWEKARQ